MKYSVFNDFYLKQTNPQKIVQTFAASCKIQTFLQQEEGQSTKK